MRYRHSDTAGTAEEEVVPATAKILIASRVR